MAKKIGKDVKPEVRYIKLEDESVRELKMDFSAKAEMEAVLIPGVRKLAEKLGRMPTKKEMKGYDYGMGPSKQTAWMAYCLSTSWREDNGKAEESFVEFKRLIPMDDAKFAAIAKAVEAVTAHLKDADDEDATAEGKAEAVPEES